MRINADFTQAITIRPQDREWVASPSGGVERCMLDRIGGEVARATSLVRFAAGSSFPSHTHGGGEEYYVVEGTFSDNEGDFPAGHYVRNPIGTSHTPHTDQGCMIFVKLHQFAADDDKQFSLDLNVIEGASQILHQTSEEQVSVITIEAGALYDVFAEGGAEVLVLEGAVVVDGDEWLQGTWSRQPDGTALKIMASESGAKLWLKTGHLAHIRLPE